MAKFAVGDAVMVRDAGEENWLAATVYRLTPLEVLLGGSGTPFKFDEVKSAKDTDVILSTSDATINDGRVGEEIIIQKPSVHPTVSKSYMCIILVSLIQLVFLVAVIGDGQSVVVLNENKVLPTIFSVFMPGPPEMGGEPVQMPMTLREVLFYPYVADSYAPYGMGPNHDTFQRSWRVTGGGRNLREAYAAFGKANYAFGIPMQHMLFNALSKRVQFHPAAFFGCEGLVDTGMAAKVFCYIAAVAAFLQLLISGVHLLGASPRIVKLLGVATTILQLVLICGFLTVILLINAIMGTEWHCNNPLFKVLKISDHFSYNYALPLVIVGMLLSVINVVLGVLAVRRSGAPIAQYAPLTGSLGTQLNGWMAGRNKGETK